LGGKFEQFGLFFEKLNRNVKWKNKALNFLMEFDALLENDKQAMIVEVKSKLITQTVDEQIKRMEKLRRYANACGDRRRFYCAMATLTAPANIINNRRASSAVFFTP
jgi:histidyl-tRNA synthetase